MSPMGLPPESARPLMLVELEMGAADCHRRARARGLDVSSVTRELQVRLDGSNIITMGATKPAT